MGGVAVSRQLHSQRLRAAGQSQRRRACFVSVIAHWHGTDPRPHARRRLLAIADEAIGAALLGHGGLRGPLPSFCRMSLPHASRSRFLGFSCGCFAACARFAALQVALPCRGSNPSPSTAPIETRTAFLIGSHAAGCSAAASPAVRRNEALAPLRSDDAMSPWRFTARRFPTRSLPEHQHDVTAARLAGAEPAGRSDVPNMAAVPLPTGLDTG
ncbi:hypothetical protein ACCO45_007294 [Purpureocillium lilacinum]|uniref:Uncharacterized protein n=1 Tax=Purpureocillium lilacinum TaxID=33203 RepID=A0ACC4DTA0_PURLI